MSRPLDPITSLIANTVLETTVDQLAIVGGTLPPPVASEEDDVADGGQVESLKSHENTSSKKLEDILPMERRLIHVIEFNYSSKNV